MIRGCNLLKEGTYHATVCTKSFIGTLSITPPQPPPVILNGIDLTPLLNYFNVDISYKNKPFLHTFNEVLNICKATGPD